MTESSGDLVPLAAGVGGTIIGVIGTIIVAVINRQSPMAALVDARIRILIEGYEKRSTDLQEEIRRLEARVDALTKDLDHERRRRASGD